MTLTGQDICALMRKHGVTIRDLKARFGVTLKRTRYVRTNGVAGGFALDWIWMITGSWPEAGAPAKA